MIPPPLLGWHSLWMTPNSWLVLGPKLIDFLALTSWQRCRSRGGGGELPSHFLADQLTLSQPGGTLSPPSTTSHPGFSDLAMALQALRKGSQWQLIKCLVPSTLTCQIIVQQILLFFGKNNTYTTLLGPTCLLISENFPPKPDFHLHKCEKILPTRP